MAQNAEQTWKRLDDLWKSESVASLPVKKQKYVIFSDIHLGDGGKADDFARNRDLLVAALDHYRRAGFTLILLGDIEELWQFELSEIIKAYGENVYHQIRLFGDERVIRIFGNHDLEWRGLVDPIRNTPPRDIFAPEALRLSDSEGNDCILLVHGHQGSLEADSFIWFSRFFVRLYSLVEPLLRSLGIIRNPSTARSQIAKNFERILYTWAKRSRVILICGHSHRAIFAAKSYAERLQEALQADHNQLKVGRLNPDEEREIHARIKKNYKKLQEEKKKGRLIDPMEPDSNPLPCYFNSGCGLYSEGITTLEIEQDQIQLVKWHRDEPPDRKREILYEGKISQFLDEIRQNANRALS